MTQGLLFSSGTGTTRTDYSSPKLDTRPPESMRGSVNVVLLRRLLRLLFTVHGSHKAAIRSLIVQHLTKVRDSEDCIDELLQLCAAEGGADGLDAAIDILAMTRGLILSYAKEYLLRDAQGWSPDSERAYKPNDDYWYVLLRAVARSQVDASERYRIIVSCGNAESRGMREAVVEALRDLATPSAKGRLRKFVEEDTDSYVRQVAQEALVDLES